jgi:hypothetical protein
VLKGMFLMVSFLQMHSNTILEHETILSPAQSSASLESREHKVYKNHFDPSFFQNRSAGLEKVKSFLLSLPLGEQSTWTFEEAPAHEESSDLDTESGAL